jgi:hypothetical protein
MPFEITHFEDTPNPNAVKVWLDKPISAGPVSFLNAEAASHDAIAGALFDRAGATSVLFNGEWLTFNKKPNQRWSIVKEKVRKILAESPDSADHSAA